MSLLLRDPEFHYSRCSVAHPAQKSLHVSTSVFLNNGQVASGVSPGKHLTAASSPAIGKLVSISQNTGQLPPRTTNSRPQNDDGSFTSNPVIYRMHSYQGKAGDPRRKKKVLEVQWLVILKGQKVKAAFPASGGPRERALTVWCKLLPKSGNHHLPISYRSWPLSFLPCLRQKDLPPEQLRKRRTQQAGS